MTNLLGYRDFSSQRQIRETIKTSLNYSNEDIDIAELFYFFATKKQRTWFVATNKKGYIILDDVRKEGLKVNRSYNIASLYSSDKLKIRIDSSYKTMFGRLIFPSSTRGWLYSKNLYPSNKDLSNKLKSIIKIAID